MKPTGAQKDDIIYEMNVRGLTASDPSVPEAERGTYAGAGKKAASLKALGVTAVELQPVQEVQNDQNDIYAATHGSAPPAAGDATWNSGRHYNANYWGYMTLAYFAPDRRYASNKAPGGPTAEFQAMVKAFHQAGIKVYLDVVYNHTGEGAPIPNTGAVSAYPLYGMRGLDNGTYYELAVNGQGAANAGYYDANGAGPNYNTHNRAAQTLIVNSLFTGARPWAWTAPVSTRRRCWAMSAKATREGRTHPIARPERASISTHRTRRRRSPAFRASPRLRCVPPLAGADWI